MSVFGHLGIRELVVKPAEINLIKPVFYFYKDKKKSGR